MQTELTTDKLNSNQPNQTQNRKNKFKQETKLKTGKLNLQQIN
jgi:hypothetical protein